MVQPGNDQFPNEICRIAAARDSVVAFADGERRWLDKSQVAQIESLDLTLRAGRKKTFNLVRHIGSLDCSGKFRWSRIDDCHWVAGERVAWSPGMSPASGPANLPMPRVWHFWAFWHGSMAFKLLLTAIWLAEVGF
jgi:hypothetical protein